METTRFIYYIISKGQSPILEALHMKEKTSLVSLQPAEKSKQAISIAVSTSVFRLWSIVNCLNFIYGGFLKALNLLLCVVKLAERLGSTAFSLVAS